MRYTVKYVQVSFLSWAHKTDRGYETWMNNYQELMQNKEDAYIMSDINQAFRFKAKGGDPSARWWYVVEEVE